MASERHLGPWIALAGLLVGGGLFAGLYFSRREPASPVLAPPAPPHAVDVTAAARAAFEPLRVRWRDACWDRAAPSIHIVEVSFDARGHEIMRTLLEERGRTRVDIAACLREQPHTPVTIAPPGAVTSARFEIGFP